MSYPSRSLLSEIHLGWVMHGPPGRTLSQNDWPETIQNHKTRDCEPHDRTVFRVSLMLLLSTGSTFLIKSLPIKSLALSAHVSPQTIHFRVFDKSPPLGSRRGPPSSNRILKVQECQTKSILLGIQSGRWMLQQYSLFSGNILSLIVGSTLPGGLSG